MSHKFCKRFCFELESRDFVQTVSEKVPEYPYILYFYVAKKKQILTLENIKNFAAAHIIFAIYSPQITFFLLKHIEGLHFKFMQNIFNVYILPCFEHTRDKYGGM